MLSPKTLERVSCAYRRGYNDGYYEKDGTQPQGAHAKPGYVKPFAGFDYEEGVKAGRNDRHWEDFRRAAKEASTA